MEQGSRRVWLEEKHLRDDQGRFSQHGRKFPHYTELPKRIFEGKLHREVSLPEPKPGTEKRVSYFIWDRVSKKLIKIHPKENLATHFKRMGLPKATSSNFGEYPSMTGKGNVYKIKPGGPEWGYSKVKPYGPVPNPRWFISPYSRDNKGALFETQYKKQIQDIAEMSPRLRRYLKGGHWVSEGNRTFDFINNKHIPPLAIEIRGFNAGSGYGSGDQPGHRIGNRGYTWRKEDFLKEKEQQGIKYQPIKLALLFKTNGRNPNGTFKIDKLIYAASRPGIGQWHVKQLSDVLYDTPKEMI